MKYCVYMRVESETTEPREADDRPVNRGNINIPS